MGKNTGRQASEDEACIGFAAGCRCLTCVDGHEAAWTNLKRGFEAAGYRPDSTSTGVPRGFEFTIGEAQKLFLRLHPPIPDAKTLAGLGRANLLALLERLR